MRRLAALALSLPSLLSAQTTLLELQPGVRVRVMASPMLGGRYDATIGARRGDTLSLVRSGSPSLDIPISAITTAEVYRGKDRVAGMRRGILWGTGIGVGFGLLLALGANSEDNCLYVEPCDPSDTVSDAGIVGFMAFGGILYGAGIGALVGRQRWDRLQVPNQRASLLLDHRATGMRVGVRLSF